MTRILLLLLTTASLSLTLTACGERQEPTGEVAPSYPVTAPGAAETPLTISGLPERIVALSRGSAELLDALGVSGRVVGAPAGVVLADGTDPEDVVTPTGRIDAEAVAALQPDLIVATAEQDAVGRAQAQDLAGAPLYLQPSRTVDDVLRAVAELGAIVGTPVEARRLKVELRDDIAATESRLRGVEPVSAFVDAGLFVTLGSSGIFGDLLRRALGENVAPDPSAGPISAAALAEADPDVYLVTSDSRITLESLRRRAETSGLTAVEEGRFAVLPLELVTTPGPGISAALQELAVALHPDAFR